MTTPSLPISDIVRLTMLVAAQAPTARGFGVALILGPSTHLTLDQRIKTYSDIDAVGVDFLTTDPEYLTAETYFLQEPQPDSVKIGRQFLTAQKGFLFGGQASATLGNYTGITNGGFDITIDGVNKQIFALDFSGAASLAAVATLIQTKLNAAAAGTTCTWDATNQHFVITSPTTGAASSIGFAVAPTGGSSPTDQSVFLALTSMTGAAQFNGVAAESITAALTASKNLDADWYGLLLTASASVQNIKDAAAYIEANINIFAYTTGDANAKNPGISSDLGSFFKNLGYSRTFGQYSSQNPNAAASALARALIVDFTQPNSTITLMFKQEPGVAPEPLLEGDKQALDAKSLNYYANYGTGFLMLAKGKMANGRSFDEVMGLDWLQNALQTAAFGKVATSTTKIPQTNPGAEQIVDACRPVLAQAKTNGLLAAGNWTGNDIGEVASGDFLPNGSYIFAGRVQDQTQSDREARKAPPITMIGIGAGAIESVDMTFIFQR